MLVSFFVPFLTRRSYPIAASGVLYSQTMTGLRVALMQTLRYPLRHVNNSISGFHNYIFFFLMIFKLTLPVFFFSWCEQTQTSLMEQL